jgi:hypothetical protein
VIIPALTLAERDRHLGHLEEHREQFILENTRLLVERLAECADELVSGKHCGKLKRGAEPQPKRNGSPDDGAAVACIPARGEADEIAALMLEQLLVKRGIKARTLSCTGLACEAVEQVKSSDVKIACVAVVPPFGYAHARYLCRRLKEEIPELRLIAAVLTEREPDELKQRRPRLTVDEVASSLKQVLAAILSFLPTTNPPAAQPASGAR